MKLRRKSLLSLPLPISWKTNIQINVYFCLNISFTIFHSCSQNLKIFGPNSHYFQWALFYSSILFPLIMLIYIPVTLPVYLHFLVLKREVLLLKWKKKKKKRTQSLKYVRGRYWPVRPHVWEHSDQVDQSESWQFTGHSTTQDIFICHAFSKPSWKKMLNCQQKPPGLYHQCKVKSKVIRTFKILTSRQS